MKGIQLDFLENLALQKDERGSQGAWLSNFKIYNFHLKNLHTLVIAFHSYLVSINFSIHSMNFLQSWNSTTQAMI